MKKLFLICIGLLFLQNIQAQELKNQKDSLSYAMGVLMAQNLKKQGMSNIDPSILAKAMQDQFANNTSLMDFNSCNKFLMDIQKKEKEALNKEKEAQKQRNTELGQAYLTTNGQRKGVVTLPSGLQYEVLTEGTGAIPTTANQVKVHYTGTLIDGTIFDSSVQRGEPIVFPVTGVIKGWTEALQLMKVGSKWKLFIPSALAYGEQGAAGGKIGPNATLIFEVELLGIEP
jgi:FKBP-type peptidyl-prolyl cis-trans isomerase FklB